ncbi:GTP 3',8-cyclase MoaA [Flavobacterium sp.]|uniref:GTP 3',8-cyclase MoaA n=1 Tax=Flavobacterium sp. TaxID=239 RepID=UPI0037BFBC7D
MSLTDVCNFRCQYCIPDENTTFMPSSRLMSVAEIDAIACEFVKLGVNKIRLTGGEPLVRKDFSEIVSALSKYPIELTLTTNGLRIHEFIDVFKKAGIKSINVSLDTLDKDQFFAITKRNVFEKVWNNIQQLVDEGFHVKVNTVVMKGFNDSEILDFIEWTKEQPVHVRFIEFMPFDKNQWNTEKVFSYQEILDVAATKYSFIRMKDGVNETAKKFKPFGHEGSFAVISTMSDPFCGNCNRMRLTADGKMKNCLFSKGEADILAALRNSEDIVPIIRQCVATKAEALGGQFEGDYKKIDATKIDNRSMINIGG